MGMAQTTLVEEEKEEDGEETSESEVVKGEWRKEPVIKAAGRKERQEGRGPRGQGPGRCQSAWVGGRVSCCRGGLRPEVRFQL